MSHRLKKELIIDAFQQAVNRLQPVNGLIFHSDRDSQNACDEFRKMLSNWRFVQSMSGSGNCYDNAVAESIFCHIRIKIALI